MNLHKQNPPASYKWANHSCKSRMITCKGAFGTFTVFFAVSLGKAFRRKVRAASGEERKGNPGEISKDERRADDFTPSDLMNLTRRAFVLLTAAASAGRLLAQGVAPRNVKPQAKPAPSGRPFDAHFTDVARQAGLTAPVIYGNAESKDYILEATGCGCAFFDFDNDGWMDIFLLSGTRVAGAPTGAT